MMASLSVDISFAPKCCFYLPQMPFFLPLLTSNVILRVFYVPQLSQACQHQWRNRYSALPHTCPSHCDHIVILALDWSSSPHHQSLSLYFSAPMASSSAPCAGSRMSKRVRALLSWPVRCQRAQMLAVNWEKKVVNVVTLVNVINARICMVV